ncbi:hypothetical protein VNO77_02677 [Canavalia gladiata]|uniref:Uncharacterized protein n=1 Tax=Canavalia gladiata TaxID=3824 RepID=A0AAN9MZX1_CANGL
MRLGKSMRGGPTKVRELVEESGVTLEESKHWTCKFNKFLPISDEFRGEEVGGRELDGILDKTCGRDMVEWSGVLGLKELLSKKQKNRTHTSLKPKTESIVRDLWSGGLNGVDECECDGLAAVSLGWMRQRCGAGTKMRRRFRRV